MTPDAINNRAPIFERMFEDGAKFAYERPNAKRKCYYTFRVRKICDVYFPTGELIACDPGRVGDELVPFTRRIPRGTFPAFVSLVGSKRNPQVVSAKVHFDSIRPAKWEMAHLPKQNPNRLKKKEFFGFGVDGGMAAMGDRRTFDLFREGYKRNDRWEDKFVYQDHLWTSLMNRVDEKDYREQASGGWSVDDMPRYNLAICKSGLGDGAYPVFFGTTTRGRIVCALIDFFVIDWEY